MRRLALLLGTAICLSAQQGTTAPAVNQAPANPPAQGQNPGNPADSIPPDSSAPPPVKKAPEPAASGNEEKNPLTDEAQASFSVRAREVNVIFTVTDKRGKFIRDLKRENFAVSDNKKKVPDLRSFSSETNLPLRVGLLIDLSSSIRERFKFEQEAAIEFLAQIIRPKQDYAFTIGFDTAPETTQDWTNSTEKLSTGIRMMRPGGGTALYDAVYLACRDKLAKRQESTPAPVRRAIILLSDGDDNQSRATLKETIDMAQRAEVIIYTISTSASPNEDKGDRVLKKLSEETGGRTFHPFKIEQVADAFRDIQEELRSQYALSFKPPELVADGSYHEIGIEIPQNKKLQIRARKGYYAPKTQ